MVELLSSSDCFKKYGSPELEKGMTLWDVPKELEIGVIPKRLYCNKDLIAPLTKALQNLIKTCYRDWETDRKSTRLNSSHSGESRMPSSA